MPLTNIEYASLASSEVMNNNFEYLDDRITAVAENLVLKSSSIYSNLESINSSFTQKNYELENGISDLNASLENLAENVNSLNAVNNSPDYNSAIKINALPYTVLQDGYVFAGVNGIDLPRYVRVNGALAHGHCGYSGGKDVYSASLIRVSAGDVVTADATCGYYYFYPMKGV